MHGYTKVFYTMLDSTIWREDKDTRILWTTMLLMAGKEGVVEASLPGLADRARLTIPETEAALVKLMAPDPHSRSKDFDGRRVKAVPGAWIILNHGIYRQKARSQERQEYQEEYYKTRHQERKEIETE